MNTQHRDAILNRRAIPRIPHAVIGSVTIASGEKILCELIDFSIKGVGLCIYRTDPGIFIGDMISVQFSTPLFNESICNDYKVTSIAGRRIGAEIVK